ncbi:hypothetical protein PHMEG_00025243 [Phytophthora megakarya]|uniref:Uncharacterized protein n=1 Tax=Phytophthora megakarya TaxID=4795 RepID=A0A225VF21_9STRA|nr:hypothetical protein PHMEG_00025243 [Phytophthora megakarya]
MALNVGGPVWAMDWLPSKPAANAASVAAALTQKKPKKPRRAAGARKKAQKQPLKGKENNQVEGVDGETNAASTGMEDGKVVKATPPDHFYDVPESARNLIQIWAVPVQQKDAGTDMKKGKAVKKVVKPRMVYAVDHENGVAWDLQWCPLVKKFPKTDRREHVLGILAVCFGDGSMRVFEIPKIPEERLQLIPSKNDCLVEKNIPIVVASLPRIMQLSVQWSPHHWHLLLTGGSDGSVSLWNIKSTVCESSTLESERTEPEPIEPQRRFQDADTVGKQEAFDWGCGWVAIRAVAWSPFDDYLFATTGNDSVFKVWDVREPRVCIRSHRIRSTWGLALQWMDQTSIQISGDQGSVYMYDILTGSYQKLHFHPQIDSPVWDLQFARRGALPLLVSSCTSGSIRAAPAKKMYRAPQNCVEICRISGKKDSSITDPFKSMTVSFEKHTIFGSAESASLNTREFCERDAALHRLRLSSSTPGDYPCFMAAGGHAGLVILLEMQDMFDTLIPSFFLQPIKKIGRPRKILAPANGHLQTKNVSNKVPGATVNGGRKARTFGTPANGHLQTKNVSNKAAGGVPGATVNGGRKARTFGSLATGNVIPPNKKKSLGKSKRVKPQKKSFIQEDEEVEMDDSVEEEEPEFEDDEEDEDESDLSLVVEDTSDDDRVSASDNDIEEEPATTNENPEEARMMKEYQLDLSEEDAILLAIQMSEFDNAPPAAGSETCTEVPNSTTDPNFPKEKQKKVTRGKGYTASKPKVKVIKTISKVSSTPKSGKVKKRARSIKTTGKTNTAEVNGGVEGFDAKKPSVEQMNSSAVRASTAPTTKSTSTAIAAPTTKSTTTDPEGATVAPKAKSVQPKKTRSRKSTTTKTKTKKGSPVPQEVVNQDMALHAFEYQMGMSEKDAIKEAIRLSEMGDKCRPLRVKQSDSSESIGVPTPTQPKQVPGTPRTKGASQKKQKKVKVPKDKHEEGDAAHEDDSQQQRQQTPRRLQFSPLNGSEIGDHADVPTANIAGDTSAQLKSDVAKSPRKQQSPNAQPLKKSPAKSECEEKKPPTKATKGAAKSKKTIEVKQPSSQSAAAALTTTEGKKPVKRVRSTSAAETPATPKGKTPAKRARSTGTKNAGPPKKRKKTATSPRGGRRNGTDQSDFMSEEDAILLALKMSEIEY